MKTAALAIVSILLIVWMMRSSQGCGCDHRCGPVCCKISFAAINSPKYSKCICGDVGEHICVHKEMMHDTMRPQPARRSCALLYNSVRGEPRSDMEAVPMDVAKQ